MTISPWNFYRGWEIYQGHLVKAIAPLTAEQLELKIAPNLRSIGLLAKHIVRTRAGWLYTMMGEGGPDIAAIAQWKHDGDLLSNCLRKLFDMNVEHLFHSISQSRAKKCVSATRETGERIFHIWRLWCNVTYQQ